MKKALLIIAVLSVIASIFVPVLSFESRTGHYCKTVRKDTPSGIEYDCWGTAGDCYCYIAM